MEKISPIEEASVFTLVSSITDVIAQKFFVLQSLYLGVFWLVNFTF